MSWVRSYPGKSHGPSNTRDSKILNQEDPQRPGDSAGSTVSWKVHGSQMELHLQKPQFL